MRKNVSVVPIERWLQAKVKLGWDELAFVRPGFFGKASTWCDERKYEGSAKEHHSELAALQGSISAQRFTCQGLENCVRRFHDRFVPRLLLTYI